MQHLINRLQTVMNRLSDHPYILAVARTLLRELVLCLEDVADDLDVEPAEYVEEKLRNTIRDATGQDVV